MTVVTKENGNYIMTIKDWSAMEQFRIDYLADPTSFNATYNNYIISYGSNEAALLKMFGDKINLYKKELNSSDYQPRILNSDNTPTVKPCPN